MPMSGWIKLHRGLIDWEWYTDHNTCRLFIHCIIRANFDDKVWRGMPIKRGSFYTSLDTLASETGLTHRQIRTAFDKLSLTGEVTSSGMARGRMITVHEYESYQQDDRLNVSEKAGYRQALDRVATTNKNLITKEVKKETITSPSDDCPHQQIIDLYHQRLPQLRRVKIWSDKRQKNLRTRWRENPNHQSLDFWERLFGHVGKSDFLIGNKGEWQADLEWIINPSNFVKIIEGKYDA